MDSRLIYKHGKYHVINDGHVMLASSFKMLYDKKKIPHSYLDPCQTISKYANHKCIHL